MSLADSGSHMSSYLPSLSPADRMGALSLLLTNFLALHMGTVKGAAEAGTLVSSQPPVCSTHTLDLECQASACPANTWGELSAVNRLTRGLPRLPRDKRFQGPLAQVLPRRGKAAALAFLVRTCLPGLTCPSHTNRRAAGETLRKKVHLFYQDACQDLGESQVAEGHEL